jgi:hypothetical protein
VELSGGKDCCNIVVLQQHSCTLSNGGAVSCWGSNSQGQVIIFSSD